MVARTFGLRVTGSGGVLLRAKREGLLGERLSSAHTHPSAPAWHKRSIDIRSAARLAAPWGSTRKSTRLIRRMP